MQVRPISWTAAKGWTEHPGTAPAPDLVLYFGGRATLADGARHAELRAAHPDAVLLGCSSGGHALNEDVYDAGLVGAGDRLRRDQAAPRHGTLRRPRRHARRRAAPRPGAGRARPGGRAAAVRRAARERQRARGRPHRSARPNRARLRRAGRATGRPSARPWSAPATRRRPNGASPRSASTAPPSAWAMAAPEDGRPSAPNGASPAPRATCCWNSTARRR